MNSPALSVEEIAHSHQVSKLAFALMAKHHVPPLPENYSVWYYYALSEDKSLVKEVDTIINEKLGFTPDTNHYLYNKFVAVDANARAADESAAGAHKLLGEVLSVVRQFQTDTSSYNEGVDTYLEKMAGVASDSSVKDIVKELISATAELKQSGNALNQRLAESQKEVDSLRKNLEKVTTESQRDFLTGVFNRKALSRFMEENVEAARREKTDLCLLMADVDHFKQFNDRFGHLMGDEVLKIVARSLVDMVKGKDVVARFGGEEFAVLLPETPLKGGLIVAEAIRAAIASRKLKRKDTGATFAEITVSIGVSLFRPSDTEPTFIKRADEALYQSKKNGRNRVTAEAQS